MAYSVDGRGRGDILCGVRDMALLISRRLIRSLGPLGQWRHVGSVSVANGSSHCPLGEGMCCFPFNLFDYGRWAIYSCFRLSVEMVDAFVIFLDRFAWPCFARELIHCGVFSIIKGMFMFYDYVIIHEVNVKEEQFFMP